MQTQTTQMNNGDHLNLEIMLTYNCNFRCTYCYEKTCDYKHVDITKETIDNILKYVDWYLSTNLNNTITLNFWGGEPSIKHDIINFFVDYYLKNRRVDFRIFTNGLLIDPIIEIAKKAAGRFHTQISYDFYGQRRRILANNQSSKEKVLESIKKLSESGVPYNTKTTVLLEDLPFIDKLFDEYVLFYKEMQAYNPLNLAITVDTTATWLKSDDDFEKMFVDFKSSLKKVLKKAFDENVYEFNWFQESRALCHAGKTFFCVDLDGKIYTCHGTIFTKEKSDHLLGSIDELKKIDLGFSLEQPDECMKCDACVCFRCNVHTYMRSKKETFKDRWIDFANNSKYCRIQKEISKITYAFKKIMEKKRLGYGKH